MFDCNQNDDVSRQTEESLHAENIYDGKIKTGRRLNLR